MLVKRSRNITEGHSHSCTGWHVNYSRIYYCCS